MNISKEDYDKKYSELKAEMEVSQKRNRTVFTLLRLCGLIFVAGAVFTVFKVLIGVIICSAAAILYIAAFYIEVGIEKKEQLKNAHMIFTKKALSAVYGCQDPLEYDPDSEDILRETIEDETDKNRKFVLSCELFRLLCDKGEPSSAFDVLYSDEELFAENTVLKFIYSCCLLRYYLTIKKKDQL